jgi:hypothetical protein
MKWNKVGISFGPEDHLDMELSDRNLFFMIKIPIGRHKLAKTLIDSGASLNLMMRKTFSEMGHNLVELTPVHDTFHGIIPGQSSTPIGRNDLEVSCASRENKRREMLTFKVASFNIEYNCIHGRPFLLKFLAVIHTAYAMIKMPRPKGIITLKSDHRDALACENAALTQAGRFGEKEAQELAAKKAKMHGGSTLTRMVAPKRLAGGTPGRLQRRRAHSWAPRQTSPLPISRRMIRRRGPRTTKFRWTPTTLTRSSVSAWSSSPNRKADIRYARDP